MRNTLASISLLATLALLFLAPSPAHAQNRLDQLRQRMEARYPEIVKFKDAGQLGETFHGLLDAVDSKFLADPALAKVLQDENADRQELYQAIAAHEKTSVQTVAQRSAQRNFERAHKGDYLKGADNKWTRKP